MLKLLKAGAKLQYDREMLLNSHCPNNKVLQDLMENDILSMGLISHPTDFYKNDLILMWCKSRLISLKSMELAQ